MTALLFRLASKNDISRIWEIILQAKAQMARAGSKQWQDGYPTIDGIAHDISLRAGFVLCNVDKIVAYAAISFDSEPAYNDIQGKWLSNQSYVVVHRLAVADEVKHQGVATRLFLEASNYAVSKNVHSFRIDTNFDNIYMLKLLKNLDFIYCGEVDYGIRGKRVAYEKILI